MLRSHETHRLWAAGTGRFPGLRWASTGGPASHELPNRYFNARIARKYPDILSFGGLLPSYFIIEALKRRDAGEPLVEIARTFGVSHSTISRLR